MLNNKYIEEEIWRLKNKDKPKVKDNSVPPNLVDTPIDQRNLKVADLPKSKINEILKIKEIDLPLDFLKMIDTWSKLSQSERDTITWMLKRSGK